MHAALDDLVRGSYLVNTKKQGRRRGDLARTSASFRHVLSSNSGITGLTDDFVEDLLTLTFASLRCALNSDSSCLTGLRSLFVIGCGEAGESGASHLCFIASRLVIRACVG